MRAIRHINIDAMMKSIIDSGRSRDKCASARHCRRAAAGQRVRAEKCHFQRYHEAEKHERTDIVIGTAAITRANTRRHQISPPSVDDIERPTVREEHSDDAFTGCLARGRHIVISGVASRASAGLIGTTWSHRMSTPARLRCHHYCLAADIGAAPPKPPSLKLQQRPRGRDDISDV